MALPLWNSKTAHASLLCLHPNDGVSLGICGSGYSSNINSPSKTCLVRCLVKNAPECFQARPKGVSTERVSMKRSDFLIFRAFSTVVSKRLL